MVQMMFAVYDKRAGMYNAPMMNVNGVCMTRHMTSIMKQDRESNYRLFPEDFRLDWIGSFDAQTGHLQPPEQLQTICEMIDIVKAADEEQKEGEKE